MAALTKVAGWICLLAGVVTFIVGTLSIVQFTTKSSSAQAGDSKDASPADRLKEMKASQEREKESDAQLRELLLVCAWLALLTCTSFAVAIGGTAVLVSRGDLRNIETNLYSLAKDARRSRGPVGGPSA